MKEKYPKKNISKIDAKYIVYDLCVSIIIVYNNLKKRQVIIIMIESLYSDIRIIIKLQYVKLPEYKFRASLLTSF